MLEKAARVFPEICAATAKTGIHTDTAKANKTGCLQATGRPMAGGSALFGGTDTGKTAGTGI